MNSSTGLPYFLVMAAVFFSLFFFSFVMLCGCCFVWLFILFIGLSYFLLMSAVFFSLFFFSFMMKRGYAFVWFVLIGIITVTFLLPLNHVFNPFVILMLGFSLVMITQYKSGKALYGL